MRTSTLRLSTTLTWTRSNAWGERDSIRVTSIAAWRLRRLRADRRFASFCPSRPDSTTSCSPWTMRWRSLPQRSPT